LLKKITGWIPKNTLLSGIKKNIRILKTWKK
jgi:hypothetical protein